MVDKNKDVNKKNLFQQQQEQHDKVKQNKIDPHNPHPRFSGTDESSNEGEKSSVGENRVNIGTEKYLKNNRLTHDGSSITPFGQDHVDATDKNEVEGNKRDSKKRS
jgi:hypothetical protein